MKTPPVLPRSGRFCPGFASTLSKFNQDCLVWSVLSPQKMFFSFFGGTTFPHPRIPSFYSTEPDSI